eukprot:5595185-Amphidinium_carterae.1
MEATHGILQALKAALGYIRWHVWQVILSPELQTRLESQLSQAEDPHELSEQDALELLCKELAQAASDHLGVPSSGAYPAVQDDGQVEPWGAYADPPTDGEVPHPEVHPEGAEVEPHPDGPTLDFDALVPADLDGLEVEPGYDSLEEVPEENREELARLANATVRRG